MKKILYATVCATTLFLGAASAHATSMKPVAMPAPAPMADNDVREFDHEKMRERMKERQEKMSKELGLTEEQKKQADEIREKGRKEVEPLMKNMRENREKMDQMREKNMNEFEKILTPEQKTKFEKIREERREKFEARRKEWDSGEGRKPRHMKKD